MTGPAALAAHRDISAGLLRERETSRTPLFLYERDLCRGCRVGKKHESRWVQAGPGGKEKVGD
jgi:hypothetical protein